MVNQRRLAVIPARGGSKRIKRKNIIDFHGKPLIYWTIKAALSSELFDDVIVSTDDEEIANIACECGASVPFLRQNHADDMASVSHVTLDTLHQLRKIGREDYDSVVQLMANCPLRDANDIKNAVYNFEKSNAPSQLSCFRYGWMNPWWAAKLQDNGEPIFLFPEAFTSRSQDLPSLFCPTGAIWIITPSALEEAQSFYCQGHIFWELPWKKSIDIDDYDDFQMAQLLFSYPETIVKSELIE